MLPVMTSFLGNLLGEQKKSNFSDIVKKDVQEYILFN